MDPPLELDAFLPYRLNRLAHATSRDLQAAYRKRHDLTVPEWRTLATLGQFDGLTATAIGNHAAMHKTKVSRAIAALQTRRLIARTTNPADRREATIRLTAAGRTVYRDVAAIAKGYCDTLFDGTSETERSAIETALTVLEARLAIRPGRPD